jgi:MFS family permease
VLVLSIGLPGVLTAAFAANAVAPVVAGPARDRQPRGLGFGLVGAAMALSAALGSPLGQLLLSHGGWRWVFAINLPLIGLAMAAGAASLPSAGARPARARHRSTARRTGLLHNRGLAAAALAMALSNLALYAALVGAPLLLAGSGAAAQSAVMLTGLLAVAPLAPLNALFAAAAGAALLAAVAGAGLGARATAAAN